MRQTKYFILSLFLSLFCLTAVQVNVQAEQVKPSARDQAEILFYSLPDDYFRSLLKEPPVRIDGQTLNPKYQYYLEQRKKSGISPEAKRAAQAKRLMDPVQRDRMRASVDRHWALLTKVTAPMKYTQDLRIPGPAGDITARAYVPETDDIETLPVVVYFHGGGWLFGSVDAADGAMRLLANEGRIIVVSSNYRMSPENKFPAAHDDAYAVYKWVRSHAAAFGGNPDKVGIGGDSAGGNMAASVSYQLVHEGAKAPALQLLYYPVVDTRKQLYPSYDLFGEGFALDKSFAGMMEKLVYADKADMKSIRMSLMQAKSFKGMPPAIIATDGFDMLRDQGKAYAERLKKDGVKAVYLNYPSLIHGWMQWSGVIDDAEKACVETARLAGKMLRDGQ